MVKSETCTLPFYKVDFDKYYSRYTKCFGDIGENIIITGVRIKRGFTEKVIFKGDVKGMKYFLMCTDGSKGFLKECIK